MYRLFPLPAGLSSPLSSSLGPAQKGFLPTGPPHLPLSDPPSSIPLVSFLALIIIYKRGIDQLIDPFFSLWLPAHRELICSGRRHGPKALWSAASLQVPHAHMWNEHMHLRVG